MTLTDQALKVFKETGKDPETIYREHQEMHSFLKMLFITNPDNVLMRDLIKKIEHGETE